MNELFSKLAGNSLKSRCNPIAALTVGSGIGAAAGCGFIETYWLAVIVVLQLLLFRERRSCLAMLAGVMLAWFSGRCCRNEEIACYAAYPASGAVSGKVVITDSRASAIPSIRLDKRIQAGFTGDGQTQTVPVLLFFDDRVKAVPLIYGDTMEVSGVLTVPASPGYRLLGDGSFEELPPPYREAYLLRLTGYSVSSPERSFFRSCFELRDKLLKLLLDGIKDPEYCAMAARLFCGASAGAPVELKQKFALAGIVHIFAVSGMHVGVIALLSCWLFRWLPLRWRMALTAAVTAGYVMCSGMAVPAVRAGTMIIVWTLLRGFLFYSRSTDILMLSFLALVMVDPPAVADLGVQYSYGITAALILGLNALRNCREQFTFCVPLMASGTAIFRRYSAAADRRFRIFRSFSAVFIAFAAGAMLTLWRMNIFNPGSIFANILITLAMPLLFVAMAVKVVGALAGGFLNNFGARLLEMFFRVLEYIAELVQELFGVWPVRTPPLSVVVIFYLLFAGALICRRALTKWVLFSLALILLAVLPLLSVFRSEEIMVISGDSGRPAVLALLGKYDRCALVCDLPDNWSGVLAADELKRCGYDEAEVCFSGGYSGNNAGLAAFASRMKLRRIILPEKQHYYFRKHLEDVKGLKNCEQLTAPSAMTVRSGKEREDGIVWQMTDEYAVKVVPEPDGRRVTVLKNGVACAVKTLPWSSEHILWRAGLKKTIKSPE